MERLRKEKLKKRLRGEEENERIHGVSAGKGRQGTGRQAWIEENRAIRRTMLKKELLFN